MNFTFDFTNGYSFMGTLALWEQSPQASYDGSVVVCSRDKQDRTY